MYRSNRETAAQRSLLFQCAVSNLCVLILCITVNTRGLLAIFKEGARNGFVRLADTGRS
jgi:hypothetical protein